MNIRCVTIKIPEGEVLVRGGMVYFYGIPLGLLNPLDPDYVDIFSYSLVTVDNLPEIQGNDNISPDKPANDNKCFHHYTSAEEFFKDVEQSGENQANDNKGA